MKSILPGLLVVGCLTVSTGCVTPWSGAQSTDSGVRAEQVITVANDFVVEVYHNGARVPDAKRKLLLDRFGATVESTTIEVRQGDWLVFHVVNNRLRWDGASYFGVAGLLAPGEFGFVSELTSGVWSVCDNTGSVGRFIAEKDFMSEVRAVAVERPWHEGRDLMERYAGGSWQGEPIWGRERSTWLKIVVR